MNTIVEPSCERVVFGTYDVVVVGGGCAGVMAAIRASRLGASVCIVERNGCLGGVATSGLVNIWHSLMDTTGKKQIIFGLTSEIENILVSSGDAVIENSDSCGMRYNPFKMQVVLDELVNKEHIKVFFHTQYSSLILEDGTVKAIFVDSKDGRGAIIGSQFIDASGDGDLCRDVHLKSYRYDNIQPPSLCFLLQKDDATPFDISKLVKEHGNEVGLDDDWGWGGDVPGVSSLTFRADNHVFGVDCSKEQDLSYSEIEGRRRSDAVSKLLIKYVSPKYRLAGLASSIGVRDSVHYETSYKVTEDDLLLGRKFEYTIARGTYRLDVHHMEDHGITFKYLDGREETYIGKGTKEILSNWREERHITTKPATYYSAPYEMLIQKQVKNLIPVGKMMNAEPSAYGALRVMVTINQMGEAAGILAAFAAKEHLSVWEVDPKKVIQEKDRF